TIFRSHTGSRHRRRQLKRLLLRETAERLPDCGAHLRQRDAPLLPPRFLVALLLLRPFAAPERAQGLKEAGLSGVEERVGHDESLPRVDAVRSLVERAATIALRRGPEAERRVKPAPASID